MSPADAAEKVARSTGSASFDISTPEAWEFTRRWLVGYRKAIGMSQKELAAIMGISQSRVSELETGKSDPYIASIATWLHGLGLQIQFRAFDIETGEEIAPQSRGRDDA